MNLLYQREAWLSTHLKRTQIFQLGYAPYRIDLITLLKGVDFEVCYTDRLVVTVDEAQVSFVNLEGLKASKRAAGRLQDLADLENLA